MRLTGRSTLRIEDFPTQREWIGDLFLPLNQLLTQNAAILNGNVLFGDNIACQTNTITIVPGAATPVSFKYNLTLRPIELRVCKATKNDVPVILVTSWQLLDSGMIEMTKILEITNAAAVAALDTTATYVLTVRVGP